MFILVAGIPLVALAAMTVECAARRIRDPAAAALVATTLAWTVCLVLEIGIFASRWVGHLALRDLQSVAPALFLVFGLWLARGVPRPAPWVHVAAFAVAVPALLLPVRRFATQESALDSFALIPFWRLAEASSVRTLELVYVLSAGLLIALAALVPQRARVALPVAVMLALLTLSVLSTRQIERLTQLDRAWVFDTGDPRWLDDAAGGPVTYLHASAFSVGVWKHTFWNRSIDSVARLRGAARVAPLTPVELELRTDGVLGRVGGGSFRPALVAAPANFDLAGERLAVSPRSTDLPGIALWRPEPPLRLLTSRSGVQPNGDILGTAQITVYACGPGRLELTLLGKQGMPIELRANGITMSRPEIAPDTAWNGIVTAPPDADGRSPCVFELVSPGLIGSTRLEFVRE